MSVGIVIVKLGVCLSSVGTSYFLAGLLVAPLPARLRPEAFARLQAQQRQSQY